MRTADHQSSEDADRRSRDLDHRMERKFGITMWMIGFFTGGSWTLLAWIISRLG